MDLNRSIINLAYEGVPQHAIARALQLPVNEVGEIVNAAVARGNLLDAASLDWPPGSRARRQPAFTGAIDGGATFNCGSKRIWIDENASYDLPGVGPAQILPHGNPARHHRGPAECMFRVDRPEAGVGYD
jgi:hypothetical protein